MPKSVALSNIIFILQDMESDNDMLEIFIEELGELKDELSPIFESLKDNVQQPELFLIFSQIIDRIYGTATTLGFKEVGEYLGTVKNITRQCGNSKIPRAMPEVYRIVRTCMENFDSLQESLKSPTKLKALVTKISMENKKVNKIETEIFAFSKKKQLV